MKGDYYRYLAEVQFDDGRQGQCELFGSWFMCILRVCTHYKLSSIYDNVT